MKVSYEYDQDPRYGWVSIDLEGKKKGLIIIHTSKGSFGFNFSEKDGSMTPACLCHAWHESECSCPNVVWGDMPK